MNCIIYYKPEDLNEAVSYYLGIMESALKLHFSNVLHSNNIENIHSDDVVAMISHACLLEVLKKNRKQKTIFWWQGIVPEELIYGEKSPSLRLRIKCYYYRFLEYYFLKKTNFNLFVSNAMRSHFNQLYGFNKDNYVIMPCFNQMINDKLFYTPNKYTAPSFVYAGGILKWQCVDEALQLYGMVKRKYPNATMTLLTRNQDEARALVEKHQLENVIIKFVPLDQLNEELGKYKYGMLLRTDDPVNNVATPTKFNSYLAVGIIPIISCVIKDYGKITDKMRYAVCTDNEKDFQSAFEQIDRIEQQQISPDDILAEYKQIFDSYYNESLYIDCIIKKLQEIFPEN